MFHASLEGYLSALQDEGKITSYAHEFYCYEGGRLGSINLGAVSTIVARSSLLKQEDWISLMMLKTVSDEPEIIDIICRQINDHYGMTSLHL